MDKRVQVYVRTLPTVSFANDVINFDEELKVNIYIYIYIYIYYVCVMICENS